MPTKPLVLMRIASVLFASKARDVEPPPLPIDILLIQRKLGGMFFLAGKLAARVDIISLLTDRLKTSPV